MTKLKPLGDHVVVKPLEEKETMSRAGIVVPIDEGEKPEKGEVIAVGQGKLLDNGNRAPMSVKVGDVVFFKKYSPDEFKVSRYVLNKENFLVLSESDILAVIE